MPEEARASRASYRYNFIREWYDRGYPEPAGGWDSVEIHHIVPVAYGGSNDFDNLVPLPREVHQEYTDWFNDYLEIAPMDQPMIN